MSLGRTTLTSINVRHFIARFISSADDMFKWMQIRAMEIIQLEGLFNNLVVLERHADSPNIGYFTYVSKIILIRLRYVSRLAMSSSRIYKLLFIHHNIDSVTLSAWKPSEVVKYGNTKKEVKKVYVIMKLLKRKKTLEKKFEETTDATKWRDLSNRIQKLKRRIHELGVVYRDGRATI